MLNPFETGQARVRGSIEVICGSMFSGKTEELLRRLRRAKIAGLRVEIFKPSVDTRYDETEVVSHDRNAIASTPIDNSSNLLQGIRIILAGLDMDFRRQPFGPMAQLCAIADSVDKIHAICVGCGSWANYSYRLVSGEQQVMLGEAKEYSPLCRTCYLKHTQTNKES